MSKTNTQLKEIFNQNRTAKAIRDYFTDAKRRRRHHPGGLELARLLHELNGDAVEREFYRVFKALQDAGFGKLVIGRSGKATRFKPVRSVFMKDIALAAGSKRSPSLPDRGVKNESRAHDMPNAREAGVSVTIHKDGSITIPKGISLTEVAQVLQDAVA